MAKNITEDMLDQAGWDDLPESRPTVPDGEFTLRIVNPQVRQNRDKTAHLFQYDAVVAAGPHSGYTIYRQFFSLKPENLWRFKRDTKAVGLIPEAGLTPIEAAESIAKLAQGYDIVAKVGSRLMQERDEETGEYVDSPDGNRENTVGRWLSAAL